MNLESQLSLLKAHEIVRQASDSDLAYLFKHALTQETVYQSLLKKVRRDIHLQVAGTIESLFSDQIDENAALLARHYAEAGEDLKTLEYTIRAGDASAHIYANAEAVSHYSLAIDAAKRLGAAAEPARGPSIGGAPLRDLYLKRGRELELASQFQDALTNYEEMEYLAHEQMDGAHELDALVAQCLIRCTPTSEFNPSLGETLADKALRLARALRARPAESKILWILVNLYRFTDRVSNAIEAGEESLTIARELNLREQMAYTLNDLTHAYSFGGDFIKARSLIEEAMGLWRELGNLPMLADSLATACMDNNIVGRFDETIRFSDEAYQISQSIGNLWGQTYSLSNMGLAFWARGESAQAVKVMEETLRLSDLSGYPVPKLITRSDLGIVLASVGAFERGLEHARQAVEFADGFYPAMRPYALGTLVQIYLWMGEPAQAAGVLALFGVGDPNSPFFSVHGFLSNARLAAALADHSRALDYSQRLLDVVNQFGIKGHLPEALYLKGAAESALGKIDSARASLLQAQAEAQAIGSRWQLWQILGASAAIELACGNQARAAALISEARAIIDYIADHAPVELRGSFLNLDRIKRIKEHDVGK